MSDDKKTTWEEERKRRIALGSLEPVTAQRDYWMDRAKALAEQLDAVVAERDAARADIDKWKLEAEAGSLACSDLGEQVQRDEAEIEGLRVEVEGLTAERDHYRQANEALRKRVAELEDAERIAWVMARFGRRAYPYISPCLPSDDHFALLAMLVPCPEPWECPEKLICIGHSSRYPWVLTPEARALIDAARDNTTEREGAEGGEG